MSGRLAIIPARGGSKRIPRKNVAPFAGRPMIAHAIVAARRSGLFDNIVVSTDDAEIAAVARDWGAQVPFRRPGDLADDRTPTVPVVAHAIEALAAIGLAGDPVCCIYPCVPLLDPADLSRALALLEGGEAAFAFAVAAYRSPIDRALWLGPAGKVSPLQAERSAARTQDCEAAYFDAGQFYWGKAEAWTVGLDIHRNGAAIVIPEWRAIDIDTPDDWRHAEALFAAVAKGTD